MTIAMLLAAGLLVQQDAARKEADERIRNAQYMMAVEERAQHREVAVVQPVSHLTPQEEAAQRKAQADRLVMPEAVK
jgi:hypothetical protein